LPRLVGSAISAELAFLGEIIDAPRALELGLINKIVPDHLLCDATLEFAQRIAAKPRKTLMATKQLLRAGWHTDLISSLAMSYWTTSTLQNTADFREGVNAALEKRPPQYNRFPEPDSDK